MIGGPRIIIKSAQEARAAMPGAFAEATAKTKAALRRAAWLEQKRGKFGASSASKLWTSTLKEANNKGSRDYIARKAAELDGAVSPETGGPSTRWGNEQEGPGMTEFQHRSGLNITHAGDEQKWIAMLDNELIGCTPDGLTTNSAGKIIPIEQKNPHSPGEHGRLLAMRDGDELMTVKYEYWCQVQHQIMVLKAPYGIFFTRDCRRKTDATRMGWWVIDRDQYFIDKHHKRLLRAIEERDALYKKQTGREWCDLKKRLAA